jgi:hypothetical protein
VFSDMSSGLPFAPRACPAARARPYDRSEQAAPAG